MRRGELISIARGFRQGILGKRPSVGMCMAVCAPLQGFLSAVHGLETTIEEVDFGFINHVYLRLADGRILDPTADQFPDMPDVYLGPWPEAYERMEASEETDSNEGA